MEIPRFYELEIAFAESGRLSEETTGMPSGCLENAGEGKL
jgi:hypothetical protein